MKSVLKPRRDSGLADTSDAESECKNTPDERSFNTANDDGYSENNNIEETSFGDKSVLNIIGHEETVTNKSEADIWESETCKRTQRERITCDNIQHNTNLYDPEKLNKGQYLEVMFKNDLIFDLDM